MKNINFGNKNVYCVGDIHGNFETLVNYLIVRDYFHNSVVIIAGDCGVGFYAKGYYTSLFEKLNNKLNEYDIVLLMIRGNHDDPYFFNSEPIDLSNIKTLEDYTVISVSNNIDLFNILCVGGATSIDRSDRMKYDDIFNKRKSENRKRYSYWRDEGFKFDEDKISVLKDKVNISAIVTHANPYFENGILSNFVLTWSKYDNKLIDDIKKEQSDMRLMLEYLLKDGHHITEWYNGHYHKSKVEYIDTLNTQIKCVTLNNIENKMDIVAIA